ncbi:substrate-binding domain-containing protein [Pseudaeromonas sp. ZJS20]|uniref:substrate-binding domain-containing protein n=1 Tax=Pseudaeromonas aegiceratis TaxID=3153928 RepID=UPI00390C665C
MATIKDVAARAGVSISTVSHVLNHTRRVSEEATRNVLEAVSALNYAPNSVARSLKVNRTRTLGLLVTASTNPFFAEVVKGVEDYAFNQGYSLILCNTENQFERQRHYLRMLMEKRVDGLLVMCTDLDEAIQELMRSYQHVPQVVMDWGGSSDFANVINDNARNGAYLAARYLLQMGHRHIACISGQLHKATTQLRLDGVRDALAELDLRLTDDLIFEGDYESQSGFDAMQQILALPQRPTAVFAFDDPMAMGALCAAHQAGIQVPEEISIMGYDDTELARFTCPPLTTINHPKAELGKTAVELLMARIRNKELATESLTVKPELVVRQSVAAPRA